MIQGSGSWKCHDPNVIRSDCHDYRVCAVSDDSVWWFVARFATSGSDDSKSDIDDVN